MMTPTAGHTVTLPGSAFPATRREFLAELRASDRAFRAIQARRFELLAQVDVLWSAASGEGPVVPGLEQLVPAGSDGTPLVAEFASLELAAAMHLRPEAIDMELSLATDCLHRLPYAWAAVMAGDLPVWLAKKLASMSGDLDFNGARALDADLRDVYGRMPAARLEAMARGLLLKHLPAEQAEERRAAERERRHVDFAVPGNAPGQAMTRHAGAHRRDRPGRRQMLKVDTTPGQPGQGNVALHHDLFRGGGLTGDTQSGGHRAFVHVAPSG